MSWLYAIAAALDVNHSARARRNCSRYPWWENNDPSHIENRRGGALRASFLHGARPFRGRAAVPAITRVQTRGEHGTAHQRTEHLQAVVPDVQRLDERHVA